MKIVKPSTLLIENEGVSTAETLIALGARICYASKKQDGNEQLLRFLIDNKHYSPFAHGILYYNLAMMEKEMDKNSWIYKVLSYALQSVYSPKYYYYDTLVGIINCRTIVESIVANKGVLKDMPEPYTALMTILKETKDYTMSMWVDAPFRFRTLVLDTNLGIGREIERHISYLFYYNEQSTRYCNFSKGKFDKSVAFLEPHWYEEASIQKKNEWKEDCIIHEKMYFRRLEEGWTLDDARKCLPLEAHTKIMITASMISWNHFIDQRANQSTGKVDPDMLVIATSVKNIIE